MVEEYWSTKCTCGSIIAIRKDLHDSIIEHQTSPVPDDERKLIKRRNGSRIDYLQCEKNWVGHTKGCFRRIEYNWTYCRNKPEVEEGCVGSGKNLKYHYLTPDSWFRVTSPKSEDSDILDNLDNWTIGHTMYFLQFCMAAADGEITKQEFKTIEARMGRNAYAQKMLGEEGVDEGLRFDEAMTYYNEMVRTEKIEYQLNLFISNMAVTEDLIIFYNEMVDLAMVDLPPGDMAKGKKNILEALLPN